MSILAVLAGCYNSVEKSSYLVKGSCSVGGSPLEGVCCVLSNDRYGSYTVMSNADGSFSFSDIWDGTYTLTVSMAGYIFSPSTMKVTVSGTDQVLCAVNACFTWSSTNGYSLDEKASSVISDGEGGFVLAGSTTSGSGGCDGYIAHFDSAGTLLWDSFLGGAGYDTLNSIVRADDGGYVAVGSSDSAGSGGSDIWLVKLSAAGALDTSFGSGGQLYIGTSHDEYGASIIRASSGGYVIAGSATNRNGADQLSDFFIASVTPSGALSWEYSYGDTKWQTCYALCESIDASGAADGFIIAGTRETSLGNYDISIMKLSLDGANEGWEKVVDYGKDDEARGVSVIADGTIAVTGFVTASNGSTDVWTGILSSGGALKKEIIQGGSSDDQGSAVVPLPSGSFLVTGTSVNTGQNRGDTDYFLSLCSPDGTVQWERRYDRGSQSSDACCGAVVVSDGYVLGGCAEHTDTKFDLWLLKTSADGAYEGE